MIFTKFDPTDIVTGRTQPVSTGLFSAGISSWGGNNALAFFTSSTQTIPSSSLYEPLNGMYYTNVYDEATSSIDAEIYFSVTYGNRFGSGSSDFDVNTSQGSLIKPTEAIYNQYRNLLLAPGDTQFTFASSSATGLVSTGSNEIYVINFAGSKVKDQLDPGQFEFTLSGSNVTNPNTPISFIDDSRYNSNPTSTQSGGKVYNIIRGTIAGGAASAQTYEGIGLMYPSLGIVVLNANALQDLVGNVAFPAVNAVVAKSLRYNRSDWLLPATSTAVYAPMQNVFFTALNLGTSKVSMKARVTEYVPARHFFVRVKNQEYNYSNNPSFVISSADNPANAQDIGKIRFTDFYTDPKVYITTVGLYNDNNDLIAVAKLSQPLLKDFTNECLIKVKIDT